MYGLAVLSIAVLVGQAAASAVAGAAALTKRQTTLNPADIPSQCKNQCAAGVNYLNTCGQNVSCLCSETTNTAFYDCLECVVGVDPSIKATLQTTLSEYEYNCGTAGAKVSFLTLTFADGSSDTPTATGASSPTTSISSNSNPSTNSNPLARNNAGATGVSVASVAGVVGVAMAALL